MDYPFSPDGLIYDPLQNLDITTKKTISNISWPSLENTEVPLLFLEERQHNGQNDRFIEDPSRSEIEALFFPLASSTSLNSSNLLLPSSSSTITTPTPALTPQPCHPFDYPQEYQDCLDRDTTDDTNMLEPSATFYNTGFGRTMITLSSHFDMRQSINLSRSSSSTSTMAACIDPSALVLNSSNKGSSVASSCISTPESRRYSSLSINSEMENVEDEQQVEMRIKFEENLSLSSTPLLQTRSYSTQECQMTPTVPSMQDLILPDGTVYRFDGTSFVPMTAPRAHFSELANQNRDISPQTNLCPVPFSNNGSIMNHTVSLMMVPRVSFSDPGSIARSCTSSSSHSDNKLARAKNYRETRQRSIQKRSRKNAFVARRTRLRSTSPSPSIKIESPQEDDDRLNQIALGRGGNSTGNNNSRNSSSYSNNKYRKDGNGVYQCPFKDCLYRYNLRRELNRHQNVHLYAGRDKYRCMNCNSGLCRLDSVKRHMEAKGKTECLKMGLYQEFKENGDLVRVRECKSSWYGSSDSNAANDLKTSKP